MASTTRPTTAPGKQSRPKDPAGFKRAAGWTPERWRAVEEYVAAAAPLLRLSDWTIRVLREPPEDDAYATMTPLEQSRYADMRVADSFLELPTAEQRQTLVHEMVHCHLFFLHECAEAAFVELAAEMGRKAHKLAAKMFTNELERATDALADALGPLLPPFDLDVHTPAAKPATKQAARRTRAAKSTSR